MLQGDNVNDNTKHYWHGDGRKLHIVPREILRQKVVNDPLLRNLYVTGIGYYPATDLYYSFSETGTADMVIIICVSGRGTYETGQGRLSVLPGQFFIISALEWHSYEADKNDPWSFYWMCLAGLHVPELCADPTLIRCFKPSYAHHILEQIKMFNDIYQTLDTGYTREKLKYCSMIAHHILALLFIHR